MVIYPVEDGYGAKDGEPPDLRDYPGLRPVYWQWVASLGLKAKDRELSQGLNKDGKPLRDISMYTRMHRKSAMTPTGKGDPWAPPLMPGRGLSRTRSLLTARPFDDHAEFWWRFDPWTGDSWARILEVQATHGRDVFGLSPKSQKLVEKQAHEMWRKLKAGRQLPALPLPRPALGGGISPAPLRGMTQAEWERHYRAPAKPISGREMNVLLRHIFGEPEEPPRGPVVVKPPRPKPIPTPKPKPKPKPGEPIAPNLPIEERIKQAEHLEKKRKAIAALDDQVWESAKLSLKAQGEMNQFMKAHPDIKLEPGDPDTERLLELERKFAEAADRVKRAQAQVQSRVNKLLEVPKADRTSWNHDDGQGDWAAGSPYAKQRTEALKWLEPKIASDPVHTLPHVTWNAEPGVRAFARSSDSSIMIATNGATKTMVHEMGHHIEYRMKGTEKAAQEFLAYRVKGQPLRKLKELFPDGGYKDDEEGRDDDFAKAFGGGERSAWYTGKHYAWGSTEIVSMGVERLFEDAVTFAKDDPEYFKFILGILDGTLRKP